jgi:ornithine cyclodeaminase
VVDSLNSSKKEAGDLILAAKETQWSFDNIYSEIGQIASGKVSGRSNDNEITIFKSVGLGIQDLAISELVLDRLDS